MDKMYAIPFDELNIHVSDFHKIAGDNFQDESLINELHDVVEQSRELINGIGMIRIIETIKLETTSVGVGNVELDVGRKIALQVKHADYIGVFVCTIGEGISRIYKDYQKKNDFLKAFFADYLGSIAVEKAMDIMQEKFKQTMADRSLNISNRYSPGYCGWKLGRQKELFSLLPDNPCGICLSASSLMHPAKSVSGIIGIGKNIKYTEYGCNLCEMDQCLYRK